MKIKIGSDTPLNILLVEDDEVDTLAIQRAIRKQSLPIILHLAPNGAQALSLLTQPTESGSLLHQELHLLITDLNMPVMGGWEFLERLRSQQAFQTLPVVVMSTSSQEEDRRRAQDLQALGYIVKSQAYRDIQKILDLAQKAIEDPSPSAAMIEPSSASVSIFSSSR